LDIFKFGQNIIGAFDQGCPLAEELMTAAREGAVDGSRDGEHFPALLRSVSRRDQRATASGGFDDEDTD